MPALRAPPASDDDRDDVDGELDDDAHLSPPQFMSDESAVRVATIAPVAIAGVRLERLPMLFEGFPEWRWSREHDDTRMFC
jgi:hypothetical protein